ncbi:MAG: adenylate/guanylate cyclase domain-containing protein [Kiloniellaceae bacterium]
MPGMTDIERPLRQAETEAEKLSALVRLAISVVLAIAVFAAGGPAAADGTAALLVALYGFGALVGLFLAWRKIFHPAIPYLFITFDVVLVAVQVLMLTRMMGMQQESAFAVPAAALIFVILIHASMRFRPWLIVYAAMLFALLVEAGSRFPGDAPERPMQGMMAADHGGMAALVNFEILPLLLISIAALTLFIIGWRTRRLLVDSLHHAARTARLSRFFSPNLAARLADQEAEGVLSGRRQPVAVLFVDIRGFTALGEAMPPEELGRFLSDYRGRLTEPVFRHGGTVDKFIGDAIMAVFGSPLQRDDDAERAVNCALDILAAAERWSAERQAAGQPPVAIGIGAHYGEVFAGAVGGEQLLEYTVIGDTVNVAERLERLSRDVGSGLVVSRVLLQAAGQAHAGSTWRELPAQELKGHRQPVEALCLT